MSNFTQPTPATRPEITPPDTRSPTSPLAKPLTVTPSVQPQTPTSPLAKPQTVVPGVLSQPASGKSNVDPKLPVGDTYKKVENAGGGLKTGSSAVAPSHAVRSDSAPKAPVTTTPTEPSKAPAEHCDTPKTERSANDHESTKQQGC